MIVEICFIVVHNCLSKIKLTYFLILDTRKNMSVYYFLHESYVFVTIYPQYETNSGIES